MAPRDLRTVLFTDLVGSTEHAARVGDRAFGELLARHHAVVRAALRQSGGREMDTAGDGFFATFARPTDALACGAAIVRGVGALGLGVRVGVHAGEVETREGKAGGITVHVAARLMAAAASDEVLVSATVRDLAAGAGWTFADRGSLTLKGLAEPVHAYALDVDAAPAVLTAGRVGLAATLADRAGRPWLIGTGAVAVLVVALLVGVSLAGGSARPSATPTAVAGGSTGAPNADTPTPSATILPSGSVIPVCGTCYGPPLVPGRYTATELPGTPTVTIADDGWEVLWHMSATLNLDRTSSPSDHLWIQWFDALPTDACVLQDGVDLGADPETQFLAWAQENKGLRLSTGIPRRFGDLAATQFDVSVVDQYACQYMAPHAVSLGAYGMDFNVGERLRLEVSTRDSQLILILIEAPSAAEFDTFEPLAEQVLTSLDFAPSGTDTAAP